MDIRNFCHVETSSEVCEDEVSAPVEKRPRTELRNTDELSYLEASQTTSGSEIDEDDFDDILGQPENVIISQASWLRSKKLQVAPPPPRQETFRSYQTTDQRNQD